MSLQKRAIWLVLFVFTTTTQAQPVARVDLAGTEPLLVNFGFAPAGNNSPVKPIRFKAENLTGPLTVSAPPGFEISKNNIQYTNSLLFSTAEIESNPTISVRFSPQDANKGYGGKLNFTSSGIVLQKPDLSASSLPESMTLDIITWNLAWLGSEFNGPTDDQLQAQNVINVMDSLKADMYMLQEVADTATLGFICRTMKHGPYEFKVSLYASNAINPSNGNWRIGQKLAFLYKKSMFSGVTARGFTSTSARPDNYYNWASGRYPFKMDANVTVNGITKKLSFINLHAKAELGDAEDYFRRKGAAEILYDSLSINHSADYFIVAGDFNDDLDVTISGTSPGEITPYYLFMSDDVRFNPVSYWNSLRGDNSYIGYPNVVDHSIVSASMAKDYVPYSCIIRKDAANMVNNYANELSDHYPVISRYDFRLSSSNIISSINNVSPPLKEAIQIINRTSGNPIIRFITPVRGGVTISLIGIDGKQMFLEKIAQPQRGTTRVVPMESMPSGLYILNVITPYGIMSEKIVH
jgi:endonuclease/exonuclease/phosphatase family metal-dependent hydrolase